MAAEFSDEEKNKRKIATNQVFSTLVSCYALSEKRKENPEVVDKIVEFWKTLVRFQNNAEVSVIRDAVKGSPFYAALLPKPEEHEEKLFSCYEESVNAIEALVNLDWSSMDIDQTIEWLSSVQDMNLPEDWSK